MIIIWWFIFAIAATMIGAKKGLGFSAFMLGLFLGPLGILIVLLSQGNRKNCPYCKELVNKDATRCPHCQKEFIK
jgi:amino acid transporter